MIEAHLKLLGTTMKDRVTGIKGMVESVCFDCYGCVQAALRPPANKDGTLTDSRWFDVKRLENAGKRIMPLPAFVDVGKEIGPASKPAFNSPPSK